MGDKDENGYYSASMRDISPIDQYLKNRDNFAQTKKDFEQIKVLNKYGNI